MAVTDSSLYAFTKGFIGMLSFWIAREACTCPGGGAGPWVSGIQRWESERPASGRSPDADLPKADAPLLHSVPCQARPAT